MYDSTCVCTTNCETILHEIKRSLECPELKTKSWIIFKSKKMNFRNKKSCRRQEKKNLNIPLNRYCDQINNKVFGCTSVRLKMEITVIALTIGLCFNGSFLFYGFMLFSEENLNAEFVRFVGLSIILLNT